MGGGKWGRGGRFSFPLNLFEPGVPHPRFLATAPHRPRHVPCNIPHQIIWKSVPFLTHPRSPNPHTHLLHLSRNGQIVGKWSSHGKWSNLEKCADLEVDFPTSSRPTSEYAPLTAEAQSPTRRTVSPRWAPPSRPATNNQRSSPSFSLPPAHADMRARASTQTHVIYLKPLAGCPYPSPRPDRLQRRSALCPSTPQQH